MPRYCAVRVCRNRGETASRQDNKRSFYPFPLHDKPRLQKWVDNMHRKGWTPSRHQYLCSEHFTEDCFDIRWGIRYLKNTAIPTIFPPIEDDSERKNTIIQRSPKDGPRTLDTIIERTCSKHSHCNRPLILSCTNNKSNMTTKEENKETTGAISVGPRLYPELDVFCLSNVPESQTATCEVADETKLTAPCLALFPCVELQSDGQPGSTVTVLCFESDGEAAADTSGLQTLSLPVPVENSDPGSFLEERGPSDGENISVFEHSYSRPDTDKDQLWSKIVGLHAKILELNHREQCTVAKIHALQTEISVLRRDGAAFREKQKALEDYISSILF